jgi:hypothetical protein
MFRCFFCNPHSQVYIPEVQAGGTVHNSDFSNNSFTVKEKYGTLICHTFLLCGHVLDSDMDKSWCPFDVSTAKTDLLFSVTTLMGPISELLLFHGHLDVPRKRMVPGSSYVGVHITDVPSATSL